MSKRQDITGQKFGMLTALRYDSSDNQGRAKWLCECDCGSQLVVTASNMKGGKTVSCGCHGGSILGAMSLTHGMSQTSEYRTWRSMKQRCTNPKHPYWGIYGGRGISVCDEWMSSFESFYDDMGPKPTPTHQIDRIDNEKGYFPLNCRWSTPKENSQNRGKNPPHNTGSHTDS